jgi:1-deoxyxylulose-5-phosphate synthase
MKYTQLGHSGLQVSRVCLGMMSFGNPPSGHPSWRAWHLTGTGARDIVRRAVDGGVTFFDTADSYSGGASEEITGSLLRSCFARREDYVLATKVYFPRGPGGSQGLSGQRIAACADASLRRLGTDYIDLYQLHRWDYGTPVEETLAALADLVRSGKVRYLGASSMWAWQFAQAQHAAGMAGWPRFVSMQNHYNLVYREEEREMIPLCADQGVGVLPYSPLARGMLAGTRQRGGGGATVRSGTDPLAASRLAEADFDVVEEVRAVAAAHGVTCAQVALAWLLSRPAVSAVVLGATRAGHIDDALAAVSLAVSPGDAARVESRYLPHAIQGHS